MDAHLPGRGHPMIARASWGAVFWVLLSIGLTLAWAFSRRRAPRALAEPDAAALGPGAEPTPEADTPALVQLALTHRPGLEREREDAVQRLGQRGAQTARPALVALADKGATFTTPRLRRAAKAALQELDAARTPAKGQLSLTEDAPQGRLSKARDQAAGASSSGHSPSS